MAKPKTRPTGADVSAFLAALPPPQRSDCERLVALMSRATGEPAVMWGDRMVGFGRFRYRYASGRAGESFRVGFAPRRRELTLYIMGGFEAHADLLSRLGPHSTGKACLYIKRLDLVDRQVLADLIERSLTAPTPDHG